MARTPITPVRSGSLWGTLLLDHEGRREQEMNNNDNKPYVQEYSAMELLSEKARERIRQADIDQEQAEVGASVRRMQREALSQDLRGTPVTIPGTMRESFVRTSEEAASRAAGRIMEMFSENDKVAAASLNKDKEANEYMGTEGSISARSRQLTAQALDNCVKDKDDQPLVCYGCRDSIRGANFPGGATTKQDCVSCIRYAYASSEEQLKRIDRYISDDFLEEIYREWRETQIDDIKKNVRQEVMDEMAKEAQVMSPNKINRIILRKH